MYINYLGHSAFRLSSKVNGGEINIITDPYDKSVGLRMTRVPADIVTISHRHYDHCGMELIKNKDPFVIDSAGEYEYKGVIVEGIQTFHDKNKGAERGINICYKISMEDLTLVHLGDLGHILDDNQLEMLEGADVLFVPVGGKYTIDAKEAVEVISQLEPTIVIPMHYKIPGSKIDIETIDKFAKEMGVNKNEAEDKLRIVKKDLLKEETKVIILKS